MYPFNCLSWSILTKRDEKYGYSVNRIYPPELQLNKTNTSDTEALFLDLHLSISNGFVSSKIYDKRDDFDFDNKSLTAKLLQQGYRYHKLRKSFSKCYRRHYQLVSKFNVGLKTLLHQGLSEPEFYGDLVYKFKEIVGKADLSDQAYRNRNFMVT